MIAEAEPRRVLRKGTSAFAKIYALFSEELFSAKVCYFSLEKKVYNRVEKTHFLDIFNRCTS